MNIENIKKKRTLEQFLSGDHALLHLNSTRTDVIVPAVCKGNPILTLKVSRLFSGRIEVSEEGVSSSLKFSGEYFDCFIPWDAIWGVSSEDGEQKIWENFLPGQILSSETVLDQKNEKQIGSDIDKKIDNKSPLRRIK